MTADTYRRAFHLVEFCAQSVETALPFSCVTARWLLWHGYHEPALSERRLLLRR